MDWRVQAYRFFEYRFGEGQFLEVLPGGWPVADLLLLFFFFNSLNPTFQNSSERVATSKSANLMLDQLPLIVRGIGELWCGWVGCLFM